MTVFQSVLFLILGVGLIGGAVHSLRTGWLPCGPNGLNGRLEFRRDAQPLGFWVMFFVYGASGAALTLFAVALLLGRAEPLPLN